MATYDEHIVRKVRTFGALQYSIERICTLLGLVGHEAEAFRTDMATEGTPINLAHRQGLAQGEYNVDAALIKSAEAGDVLAESSLRERQTKHKIDTLKADLFGI